MERSESLLVSLRSYRPREGRDSLENFVTEVFCWLLRQSEDLSQHFLTLVDSQLADDLCIDGAEGAFSWQTQFSLDGLRPDMVAKSDRTLVIFEHKVWSGLGDAQLSNYRNLAEKHYPDHQRLLVVITPGKVLAGRLADASLCWHEVFTSFADFLAGLKQSDPLAFHIREFLDLLAHEGLAPAAPVSLPAVRYYPEASKLPGQLADLFSGLQHLPWPVPEGYALRYRKLQWGRIGIEFYRADSPLDWAPGIFIGCVLDGYDHGVAHRISSELKLQLIVDFSQKAGLHNRYPQMPEYRALIELLGNVEGRTGWHFYDHLNDSAANVNCYHPLYLERPLFDVFRGTTSLVEQREKVLACAATVIELLSEYGVLERLKRGCDVAVKQVAGEPG